MKDIVKSIDEELSRLKLRYAEQLKPFSFSVTTITDKRTALDRDELSFVQGSSEQRQIEFASGRFVAKKALATIGCLNRQILTDTLGRPVWPTGFKGSISHAGGLVAAAVRPDKSGEFGVGLDIERSNRVKTRLFRRLFTQWEEERYLVQSLADDWPTIVFSAKESIYKAVNPLTQEYLGFLEVEVDLDWVGRRFSARHKSGFSRNCLIETGEGFFFSSDGYVCSIFILEISSGSF